MNIMPIINKIFLLTKVNYVLYLNKMYKNNTISYIIVIYMYSNA